MGVKQMAFEKDCVSSAMVSIWRDIKYGCFSELGDVCLLSSHVTQVLGVPGRTLYRCSHDQMHAQVVPVRRN